VSIVAQSVWSGILVLSGGAGALIRYTGFAVVLFSGVAVAALFVLRAREVDVPRPFKALGYPVAPAAFVMASCLIVGNAIYSDPRPSAAGVLIMLAGVPFYAFFARRSVHPIAETTGLTDQH
jgi:basic amino acid/polyamine antiporter, APA family